MSEPEFPLCDKDDPRVPVVLDMLRKSQLMGGNFTLDARRILAALDKAFPPDLDQPTGGEPWRCEECGGDGSMEDLCPRAGSGPLLCPWRTASNSTTRPPVVGAQPPTPATEETNR